MAHDIKDAAIQLIEVYIDAVTKGDDAREDRVIDEIRDLIINSPWAGSDADLFIEGSICDDRDDIGLVIEQAEAALQVFRGELPANRVSGTAA